MSKMSLAQQTPERMQNSSGPTVFKTNVTEGRAKHEVQRAVLEESVAHLAEANPASAAAKSAGLPLRSRALCSCSSVVPSPALPQPLVDPCFTVLGQESSFLPVVLRILELSLHVFMCRWGYSCSCAPETSGGFRFPEHTVPKVGPYGPSSPVKWGLGKKEELLGLQSELGAWEGVKFNKQSSILA